MDDDDLKQQYVNLFFKQMQVRSSFIFHRVEYNVESGILNRYHMSEINYFKILLLCKMMWQMVLNGYWHDMIRLNADVDTLHFKKIDLNDP
jgi:hypothetical protein